MVVSSLFVVHRPADHPPLCLSCCVPPLLSPLLCCADTTWTILAPTNDAFAKRLAKLNLTADAVLKNKDLLVKILSYHVIPSGAVYSKALKDNATVATALKGELHFLPLLPSQPLES